MTNNLLLETAAASYKHNIEKTRWGSGLFIFISWKKCVCVFQNNLFFCNHHFLKMWLWMDVWFPGNFSPSQKKVVEQLRKELLVKQEPDLKPQMLPATADGKTVLLTPVCPPSQPPTGPPHNQGAPQVPLHTPNPTQFLDKMCRTALYSEVNCSGIFT